MRIFVLAVAGMVVACGGGGATVGPSPTSCSPACPGGFTCLNSICVLGTSNTGGGAGGGGGGSQQNCFDNDHDSVTTCAGDCNDGDATVKPGATESQNMRDDDCDGKVDNHIAMADFDHDGSNYGETDCNDDEPLVGPYAIEAPGNMVDDNCNGQVDEVAPTCEDAISASPMDYGKAIGLCGFVTGATFGAGDVASRGIRTRFGDQFQPQAGSKMIMLSTGTAKDNIEMSTYSPQPGMDFGALTTHPFWAMPKCGSPAQPMAEDLSDLSFTIQVPQNAKSFSFQFAFFSAEYPEFVCTDYNDRFVAVLESQGLDKTKLPTGQCKDGTTNPTCNISYDATGQPVTINNGFFDVCDTYSGPNVDGRMVSNTCTKPSSMLTNTGYDKPDLPMGLYMPIRPGLKLGGGTGWLKTTAPVKPGETMKLRFLILDEGDAVYDSAVLIDNFKWEITSVNAPITESPIN